MAVYEQNLTVAEREAAYQLADKIKKGVDDVKGVTLEENGAVRFPDAPTERGVKHIRELQRAAAEGFGAHAVFVIQMADVSHFSPNDDTHPAFGAALREAAQNGVQVHAFWCDVTPDSMDIAGPVEVRL